MKKAKFLKICKTLKFTKPQQEIVNVLQGGSLIWITHANRADGGKWQLKHKGVWYPCDGGPIYRAFLNVVHKVQEVEGKDFAVSFLFHKKEWK